MPVGIYERSEEQKEFCRKLGLRGGRKRILGDINCKTCDKKFRPSSSKTVYCSYKCSLKNRKKRGTYKICLVCSKSVYVSPGRNNAKYCSIKCQHVGLIIPGSKVELKCKFCKQIYIRERSSLRGRGSRFCSILCVKKFKKMRQYKNKLKGRNKNGSYKKLLWRFLSLYVRQRDGGVCISCGKKDHWRNTDAGHYIPKTAGLSTYFDERNVNCQCTRCNRWMHGNLSAYAVAMRKKYGDNILEELDEQRKVVRKISTEEYKKLVEEYKNKLLDNGYII